MTAAFLHYGPIHLGLNMLALYFGGTALEQVIGRWRFALIYFASGIAGSAGALLLTPNSPTVGASGAIFGVFGALLALERMRVIHSGGQILALIVINLVFTFAVPGISIGGHLGGLLCGFVLMWAMTHVARSTELSVLAAAAAIAGELRRRVREGPRLLLNRHPRTGGGQGASPCPPRAHRSDGTYRGTPPPPVVGACHRRRWCGVGFCPFSAKIATIATKPTRRPPRRPHAPIRRAQPGPRRAGPPGPGTASS